MNVGWYERGCAVTPLSTRTPTVDEVDRITAIADPVIRNLHITLSYHELALALTARTGVQANWCTFATWASKQAGQTIRKEDAARALEHLLVREPFSAQTASDVALSARALGATQGEDEVHESVFNVLNPLAALDRASDAVARGNCKVYAEIGREFARFCASCLSDAAFDPVTLARFCDGLRVGDPPDGQIYLRHAFARYYAALFDADPKHRAELMLLANVEIGYHEQTRLQPEIAEALNAAFADRRKQRARLIHALFPRRGWLAQIRLFLLRLLDRPSPLDALLDRLIEDARRRARLLITGYLMTIGFPHGKVVRLGEDVLPEYPPSLRQVALPELLTLLAKFDPTPDSTDDSGAVDWAHLPDRLHFIIDLFRCYHENADLFEPPFSADQVAALRAGRLPDGRL